MTTLKPHTSHKLSRSNKTSLATLATLAGLVGAFAVGCGSAAEVNTVTEPFEEKDCGAERCSPASEEETKKNDADDEIDTCLTDAECDAGTFCSANGLCISNECKDEIACVKGTFTLKKQTPTVVLLIDQSGSMHEDFGGKTRWDALRDALVDPNTGVIKALERDVRFGVAFYSSHDGYGADGNATCPEIDGLDELGIAFDNYGKIRDRYLTLNPADDTPTAESLSAVTDYLVDVTEPGPKAIILATDGEPDTCADPDAHNDDTKAFAVNTAKATFESGISTYVLSVGNDIAENHLQDMANAGAGVASGAPFYKALDQAALEGALGKIVSGIRSCTFHLNGTVDPNVVEKASVSLDGAELQYGVDFKLNGNSEVQLIGSACEGLAEGEHEVSVDVPCACEEPKPVDVR
jgi:hypothetical protein